MERNGREKEANGAFSGPKGKDLTPSGKEEDET